MNTLATLALLLLCALLLWRLSLRRNAWRQAQTPWPLYAKRVLSSPQQVLFQRLVQSLPGYLVLSRVPLASVLGVKPGFAAALWSQRLRHLHYDFVVCSKDATVLAAIELHDASRTGNSPTLSDLTKERASAAAGVRLLRWNARSLPDQAQIQTAFGEPPTQSFEEAGFSANQSWWPPVAGRGDSSLG